MQHNRLHTWLIAALFVTTATASADILSVSEGGWLSSYADPNGPHGQAFAYLDLSRGTLTATAAYSWATSTFSSTSSQDSYDQKISATSFAEHHYRYVEDWYGNQVLTDDSGYAFGWALVVTRLRVSAGYYYFSDKFTSVSDGNVHSWASTGYTGGSLFGTTSGVNIPGPWPSVTNQDGIVTWEGYLPDCEVGIQTEVLSSGYGLATATNHAYFGMSPAATPEPVSMSLLGLGALTAYRRRVKSNSLESQ